MLVFPDLRPVRFFFVSSPLPSPLVSDFVMPSRTPTRRYLRLSLTLAVLLVLCASLLSGIPTANAGVGDGRYGCNLSLSKGRTIVAKNEQQLHDAIKDRKGGDRILVDTDAHLGPLPILEGKGGWTGAWITIAAANGRSPKIGATGWAGIDIREPFIQVCGFEVYGTATRENRDDTTRVGIYGGATHHIRVADNYVHNFSLGGININQSNNIEIVGNIVKWNSFWGKEQGSGISVFQPNDAIGSFGPADGAYQVRIEGNIVQGNANRVVSQHRRNDAGHLVATDGNGIILDDFENKQVARNKQNPYDGWTLVANNVSYLNGGRGIQAGPNGGQHVHIINNTAYHNNQSVRDNLIRYDEFGRAEFVVVGTQYQTSFDLKFINNVAVVDPSLDNETNNVMAFYRGNIADWSINARFNSFSGNAIKGFYNYPGLPDSQDDHDLGRKSQLNANPPFVNPSKGDFRLKKRWLRGANTVNSTIGKVDIDGTVRPTGRRQERGAYEFIKR